MKYSKSLIFTINKSGIRIILIIATEIGTYCGWNKPDLIRTASNEALITFVTDDKEFTWYRGFSLNYSISFESKLKNMFISAKTKIIIYPIRNLCTCLSILLI